jgi:hypothetical protein
VHPRGPFGRRGLLGLAFALALASFTSTAVASGLVTGRQIKDGSVGSVDLKAGRGLGGADVRDGSLSAQELGSLPQGPRGEPGGTGPPGLAGLHNFDYEISQPFAVDPSSDAGMTVPCAGTPIGGGASSDSFAVSTMESHPEGSGWTVRVYNASGTARDAYAWAVCASLR